ncbi:hypothetical protein B0A50_03600 [Salinomyces thailandicus]|uniref:Uncharacterized protein n=1 Tax=Salinomyces thailandicus TaxID=706561 RepID=A0A4U0U428_9PEZI|nr:hypothetical protein B0A50_03600 [Salinomyces thailandica]
MLSSTPLTTIRISHHDPPETKTTFNITYLTSLYTTSVDWVNAANIGTTTYTSEKRECQVSSCEPGKASTAYTSEYYKTGPQSSVVTSKQAYAVGGTYSIYTTITPSVFVHTFTDEVYNASFSAPRPTCKASTSTQCLFSADCRKCTISGGTVRLLYFPAERTATATVGGMRTAMGSGGSAVSARKTTGLVTAEYGNVTLTSPSVYISFHTAYANNECGEQVGQRYPGAILSLNPGDLSSVYGLYGTMYSTVSDPLFPVAVTTPYLKAAPFTLADLNWPVPASAYMNQPKFAIGGEIFSVVFDDYNPVLAVPPQIRGMDTAWKSCVLDWEGLYDPPKALRPANAIAGATTSGSDPGRTEFASPSSGLDPLASRTETIVAATHTTAISLGPDDTMQSASGHLETSDGQSESQSQAIAASFYDPPANAGSPEATDEAQPETSIADAASERMGASSGSTVFSATQTHFEHASATVEQTDVASMLAQSSSDSAGESTRTKSLSGPVPDPLEPSSDLVSNSLNPSASDSEDSAAISRGVVVAVQTLRPTVTGTRSYFVKVSLPVLETQQSPTKDKPSDVGESAVSAPRNIIHSATLDDTGVSGGFAIGSTTVQIPSQTLAEGSGSSNWPGFVHKSKAESVTEDWHSNSHVTMVSDTQDSEAGSLGSHTPAVDPGSSSESVVAATFTLEGNVYTATERGSRVAIVNHETVSVGGPALPVAGATLSMASDGELRVVWTDESTRHGTSEPTGLTFSATEQRVVLSFGSTTLTAFQRSSASDRALVVDGMTVSAGGSAMTIAGETISAVQDGAVIESSGHRMTRSLHDIAVTSAMPVSSRTQTVYEKVSKESHGYGIPSSMMPASTTATTSTASYQWPVSAVHLAMLGLTMSVLLCCA